jgi:hypothetical protein
MKAKDVMTAPVVTIAPSKAPWWQGTTQFASELERFHDGAWPQFDRMR